MGANSTESSSATNHAPKPICQDTSMVQVLRGATDSFTSKLVSTRSFDKGDVIYKIQGHSMHAEKKWSSVQIGKDEHIELNSDFMYMNHSCDPSVKLHIPTLSILAHKPLFPGSEITFFYPSTEWWMSQPFECWCGAENCLKRVAGARELSRGVWGGDEWTCFTAFG